MVVRIFYRILRLESRHLFGLCVVDLPFLTEDGWDFGCFAGGKGWSRLIKLFAFLDGIPKLRLFLNKRSLVLSLFFVGPINSQNLTQLILVLGLCQETVQIIAQRINIQKLRISHASSLRVDRRYVVQIVALAVFLKLVLLRRTEDLLSLDWLVLFDGSAGVGSIAGVGSLHAVFQVVVGLLDLALAIVTFVGFAVIEVGVGDWCLVLVVLILVNGLLLGLRWHSKGHLRRWSLKPRPSLHWSFIPLLILIPDISLNL